MSSAPQHGQSWPCSSFGQCLQARQLQLAHSDGSPTSEQGAAPWGDHAPPPLSHSNSASTGSLHHKSEHFGAPASLLPSGVLSPEGATAAFAPAAQHDTFTAAVGSSGAPARREPLGSLPVGDNAPSTLEKQPSDTPAGFLRRVSHASETSVHGHFDPPAPTPTAPAPAPSHALPPQQQQQQTPQGGSARSGSSSAASSQDALCALEWQAHPEVQASIIEMLDEEASTAVDPDYMDAHSEATMGEGLWVTPAMRLMTVNWMSEAVDDLDLSQKVISMAVLLFDRYLSSATQFPRTMLQLAAAAAIFTASKIEGTLPHPRASRIASLSDGAFDLHHLISFERVMCQTLQFDLYAPTTQNFLDMFLHALPQPNTPAAHFFAEKVHTLASYILELGSLVYDTLGRRRSVLACAALVLALADPGLQEAVAVLLKVPVATLQAHAEHIVASLKQYVGPLVSLAEVTAATSELLRLHKLAQQPENREQFVVVKFSSAKHGSIAAVARPLETVEDYQRVMRIYFHL